MKTVTNYAEKKAKQFLNLLQGYTKGIRFTAILILLLMGVSNAWAATIFNCGIEVNETWYKGTGTINSGNWLGNQTAFNNKDFGVITSLKLGGQYDTWDNNQTDNCSWNASNGITITIKKGSTQKDQFKLSCYHSGKDGNNNVWKTTGTIGQCGDKNAYGRYTHNISQYAAGNDYTIAAKWFSPSGISTTGTAKFTIPGFTTTSNSQTFESTLVGNNNSKTISFGTHYGTTLKTNNCSISGTNYTEFSVTSINESGVTVQFKPTSAGSKTATLTITDAHSKKCTIELSGTATLPTYTVTFNANGHGTAPAAQTVSQGSKATQPTAPTATGYTFGGWYKEAGCTNAFDFNTAINANITLYAKWTPKTYTITLNANDGASNGSATATYNSSTITNLTHPTRTDYRCNGYFTAATDGTLVLNTDGTLAKNVSGYTDANGNWIKDEAVTLYAQWIYDVTEYTVTFGVETGSTSYGSLNAYNNTTSASITSPAQVRRGQSITFTATPETGYLVEGWYTNAACTAGKHDAGSTTYTTSITGETSVYVKFVEQTWPVSFVASTGGTVSPAEEQTVGVITGVNISATPETGYTFSGWTSSTDGEFGDETAAETTFYPTAETTVTANFTENLFAITVTSSDNNHGTVTQSTDKAGIATTITITATPAEGYQFAKWTATDGIIIAEATSATTTITTTRAGSLTAHFEKIPPTTIYLDPGSWTTHNARFSVYYWKGNDNAWAEMVKVDANSTYYTVDIPAGYKDIMMVRLDPTKPENNWGDNVWDQTGNLTIPTNGNNLYVLDNKTVAYLHLKPNSNWITDNARFAAYFFGNGEKWVDLVKKGDYYYTCEIPTDKNYPSVIFCRMNPTNKENNWTNRWNQTVDLTIEKENNLYTVGNEAWNENNENKGKWSRLWDDSQWSKYTPSTTIQEQTGDYRMVYVESEVIGQAPYTKFHPAHSISKITEGTKKETVSFYINTDGQNPAILLQQCTTDGTTTIEWNTIAVQTINGNDGANPAIAHAPAKKAVELYIGEGCPAITGNGVYNFVLEQTNDNDSHAAQILVNEIEPYNGNYYIRTYCTEGGWDNYTENPMTYSETALSHGGYDYYFCEWILRGKNIKYAVANDYSFCISDTLSSDDITNASTLPADANVRFTWNSETNHLDRAFPCT